MEIMAWSDSKDDRVCDGIHTDHPHGYDECLNYPLYASTRAIEIGKMNLRTKRLQWEVLE